MPGRTILVTGASRGVGVTTVALHLAAAAVTLKRSTCVVDLDRTWSGAAERLALKPDVKRWDAFDGGESTLLLSALPVRGGFRLLVPPAPQRPAPSVDELITAACLFFEVTVVDLPGGDVCPLERVDRAALVVSPSRPGTRRAAATSLPAGPVAFVVNRLGRGGDIPSDEVQRSLGHRVAMELPQTPALRDAEDEGALLSQPWSRWRCRIARLARILVED
jgi:hypothetical protein